MKKNIILAAAIILLLAVGTFCGFLIYDSYNSSKQPSPEEMFDIAALIKENEDTAFAFLEESENVLPENMIGYAVDFAVDISFDDTSETALKVQADKIFEKVDAISPNTMVIRYSEKMNYAPDGFDVLSYLVQKADSEGMYVVLLTDSEDLPLNKADDSEFAEKVKNYNVDAVAVDVSAESGNISKEIGKLKETFNQQDIKLGIYCKNSPSENVKSVVADATADFCFVQFDCSTENGVENVVKQWSEIGLSCNLPVYAILRNDLVCTSESWTLPTEIYEQVRLIYNYGGFSGYVAYSHKKLSTDDNHTATKLFSYNESFNDSDYTALIFTDISIKDNKEVVFAGTTDKNHPLHVWSTAKNKWQSVETTGDNGGFSVAVPLRQGENKIVVKHKNSRYTYYVDRAVDVMTDYSAVIEKGSVILTVRAVKDAKVYASLANTQLVELQPGQADDKGYVTYTATYEPDPRMGNLTPDDISYAATFAGIDDIVMCGKEKEISPYDDHGLGKATICRTQRDYSETTSADTEKDMSDPTCTPQLAGAYGYVEKTGVSENKFLLYLDSGMKVYGASSRLILDGFVLPDNRVNLESAVCTDETSFEFSSDYGSFIKINIAPQQYYKGYLQRVYNVEEFTAEYVDVIFTDTAECSYNIQPDLTSSNVFERLEWYSNSEEKSITLRLFLKNKGDFGGYSFERCENGNVKLSFRPKVKVLQGAVIMIDPGHGGYGAPGTKSSLNIYEKEVTLSTALSVAKILRDNGATVIMTRTTDEAHSLYERAQMIRKYEPDVFVSIHNDGSEDVTWYGTHTFYYKNYSMPLADAIHKQIVTAYRTYYYNDPETPEYTAVDKGIKFYPFQVTRVEECPSVLIECGYLTNDVDAIMLTDTNGQLILATAIAQGIVDYIAG